MRKDIVKAEKNQNFDTASKNSGVTTQYILTTFIFHFNHDHSRSNTQSMNDVMIDWHKNPIRIWMSFSTFKLGKLQFWQLIKKSNTTFSFIYLRQSNNLDTRSDEFELEFSSSSRAGALQFSSWNRADNTWQYVCQKIIFPKFLLCIRSF